MVKLFTIKFTDATSKKRRYLLYYAIELITESSDTTISILPNKMVIKNVTSQINSVYKQIKRNEQVPKTEYLFNGLDRKKLVEKSIKQMEMVNSIDMIN